MLSCQVSCMKRFKNRKIYVKKITAVLLLQKHTVVTFSLKYSNFWNTDNIEVHLVIDMKTVKLSLDYRIILQIILFFSMKKSGPQNINLSSRFICFCKKFSSAGKLNSEKFAILQNHSIYYYY